MCRQNIIVDEDPELDQIGTITGVDVSDIYNMNNYPDENQMEFFLMGTESEMEKKAITDKAETDRQAFKDNIEEVTNTINNLIAKLSQIDNLPLLFAQTEWDTLDRDIYFKDFNSDTGDGYIGNNFGRDLRNFKNFLDFVKGKGASVVYFIYG